MRLLVFFKVADDMKVTVNVKNINLTNDLKSTYLLDGKQYLGAIVEAWSSQ